MDRFAAAQVLTGIGGNSCRCAQEWCRACAIHDEIFADLNAVHKGCHSICASSSDFKLLSIPWSSEGVRRLLNHIQGEGLPLN